jgi:NAD(P)-dependent dehydrogenase (short-subunit alcohol dehydrogenase family)
MKLKGQVAIVTGAGQGIGEAIALAFAREGAAVVVDDINPKTARKVAKGINERGGTALAIKADVSNADEVNILVEKTMEHFKKIDILVNNAGIIKIAPVLELTEADWDDVIDVNVKGQFLCSKAVAKHMIKQKRGKIINIASIGAHVGALGSAAYTVSKVGILQLTKVLAVEWGKYNINVNVVSPGLTMTVMAEYVTKKLPSSQGIDRVPLRRLAKPEDIADAVLFLASSESDYITGQEIIVDGGTLAIHPRMVKPTD